MIDKDTPTSIYIQSMRLRTRRESHAGSSYEPDAARVLSYELAACNTLGSTKPLAGAAEQIALQAQPIVRKNSQNSARVALTPPTTPQRLSQSAWRQPDLGEGCPIEQ